MKDNEGIINLIKNTSDLLESDVTVKTLLNSLAEGVVIINGEGTIILVNDRIAELTGHKKQDITGQSLDIIIPDQYSEIHKKHLLNYFIKPITRPMGIGQNLLIKCKDGSTIPVEISLSHLQTESGIMGLAFITDITLRKKAEDELKQKNKELDEYAHTVAHDIKSLLNGIIGFSEVLIDTWGENSKETELSYLERVADHGRKLDNIVKEILAFASMKKEDVEKVTINMKKVVQNACDRFKFQLEYKSAQINIKEPIYDCIGHAPWIEEIMYNFISNALKYGGTPPIIEIYSEKTDDGFIKYNVKDNGEGIPEKQKSIIFEEHNSEKDKMAKGHGLGLSIVRRIIEKLDGQLFVESTPGKGSIFSFALSE